MSTIVRFLACMLCLGGFLLAAPLCQHYTLLAASGNTSTAIHWIYAVMALAFSTVCFAGACRSIVSERFP